MTNKSEPTYPTKLEDLAVYHDCQADAWELAKSKNKHDVQIDACNRMKQYHLTAVDLLRKTIKELENVKQ